MDKELEIKSADDIVYAIVANWGNAVCPIEVMTGWIKNYAKQESEGLREKLELLERLLKDRVIASALIGGATDSHAHIKWEKFKQHHHI